MQTFNPTHRIGKTLYMEFDGGLYTFLEWTLSEACDYSFSEDGDLLFLGQPARGPLRSVTKEVADAYEKTIAVFDALRRINWNNCDRDQKMMIFLALGELASEDLFDTDDMVDHFVFP